MRSNFWIIFLLTLLLVACASTADLRPGESVIEDVHRTMGAPALRWQDVDGSSHLAYPHGPEGFETLLVHLGPSGKLQKIENVLDAEHFAAIKPGMGKEQVLHLLGPPQPQWTMYFKARDELAWEWHYCDDWNAAARFNVLFDATAGTVRSTISIRENCGKSNCWCAH